METGYAVADAAIGRVPERPRSPTPTPSAGRDLSDLGFYLGLAYFKIAVICEGIYYRFTQGQTLGEGFGDVGAAPEPLVQAASPR